MEEYQSPRQNKSGFFSKENLPKLIAIAAAVVVVAVLLIVLIGNSGPKAVAEKYVKACLDLDVDKMDKLSAFELKEYLLDYYYDGDEEEFFEDVSEEYDEDVTSWKELSKAYKAYLKEEYGKYKVEVDVSKVKELSAKKLESEVGEWLYEDLEDFGFDADKVKSGAEATVKVKLKGEDGKENETLTIYLAKIGGSWKVLNVGSPIF